MTALLVELHGEEVGELVESRGTAVFRFHPSYWRLPNRPVLGRWFEDGAPDETYRGWPGCLPAWFDNLEPEGALAKLLATRHGLGDGLLELLGVAGDDLPGALRLVAEHPIEKSPLAVVAGDPRPGGAFSLSGVQLKISGKLGKDGRLTLPTSGEAGDHILKLPPPGRYRHLVENEHATMAWAARAGFDVAPTRVVGPELIETRVVDAPGPALLVERFDRTPDGPIHQEDLAQVGWLEAARKYPPEPGDPRRDEETEARRRLLTSHEGLARLVAHLLGAEGLEEYLARVVLVVASGNGDAHLKNWSVVYPDRRVPRWSPLYDQVATIAWQDETLALTLDGRRNFSSVHHATLIGMATAAGLEEARASARIEATLDALVRAWDGGLHYPLDHARRLVAHWRRVPLLREHGELTSPG